MTLFLLVNLIAVALSQPTTLPVHSAFNYHELIGIPSAARVRALEEARDFDGSRIVGGDLSQFGRHPHMAGLNIILTNAFHSICGATLLSNTRLVTAAHCWWDGRNQALTFTVVLGSNMIFWGGTRVAATRVEMHGNFNPVNANNDIAIISIPFQAYNNIIRNIALPTGSLLNDDFAGQSALAKGFGTISDVHTEIGTNPWLYEVSAPVMTNAACAQVYGPVVISSTLCTSGAGGRGTCFGDSGGPLTLNRGQPVLIGVASFVHGNGCTLGHPSGFVRVTSFVSWIQARL